jgi:hypothetical protein
MINSALPTDHQHQPAEPIQISTSCQSCLRAVELSFVWAEDGDPQFGAVWLCPHCGEKQQIEAVGHVLRAAKSADSSQHDD